MFFFHIFGALPLIFHSSASWMLVVTQQKSFTLTTSIWVWQQAAVLRIKMLQFSTSLRLKESFFCVLMSLVSLCAPCSFQKHISELIMFERLFSVWMERCRDDILKQHELQKWLLYLQQVNLCKICKNLFMKMSSSTSQKQYQSQLFFSFPFELGYRETQRL